MPGIRGKWRSMRIEIIGETRACWRVRIDGAERWVGKPAVKGNSLRVGYHGVATVNLGSP